MRIKDIDVGDGSRWNSSRERVTWEDSTKLKTTQVKYNGAYLGQLVYLSSREKKEYSAFLFYFLECYQVTLCNELLGRLRRSEEVVY